MNTTENNKLISEFMGYDGQHEEWCGNNVIEYDTFLECNQGRPYNPDIKWDDLMPVIEKIESLGYKFQICRHRAQIYLDDGFNSPALCDSKSETKIQAAYAAVADFIKNYKS